MPNADTQIKKFKRQEFREQRNAISHSCQRQKSIKMMRHFIKDPIFMRSRKIAAYWPIDKEMDPRFVLFEALKRKKQCYLPILHPYESRRLLFSEYKSNDPLHRNRFGILEPRLNARTPVITWTLDIVLVPLLAFDNYGNRLGRGAGFYDHTFSFLKHEMKPHPLLIGVGYEFQREEALPCQAWDVPLSGVLTEERFTLFLSAGIGTRR